MARSEANCRTVDGRVEWSKLIRKAIWEFEREVGFRPRELWLPREIYYEAMSETATARQILMQPSGDGITLRYLFGLRLYVTVDGPLALIGRRDNGWTVRWTKDGFDEAIVTDKGVWTGKRERTRRHA